MPEYKEYPYDDTDEASREIIADCKRWDASDQTTQFLLYLNHIGLFARPYGEDAELRCQALYSAARVIHNALCALDGKFYDRTKTTTIRGLANAFSFADGKGNRRHDD